MSNSLDTLNLAAGAEALPRELLQPFDSSNPSATPVRLSGPEQRLIVTPDPGVGDAALLPPSQVLISKDGVTRSIWPVHLPGWQALGWQQHAEPPAPAPEPEPEPLPEPEPEPTDEPEPASEPEPTLEPEATEPPADPAPASGEALLATETTDFQAMTKAQIVDYCSAVHGMELDGSQTKAELVEQATALEAQAGGTAAADLAALELGDALL